MLELFRSHINHGHLVFRHQIKECVAVYAKQFRGTVELRGLQPKAYRVRDYVQGRDLGVVQGPLAKLPVHFSQSLLVEALPQEP